MIQPFLSGMRPPNASRWSAAPQLEDALAAQLEECRAKWSGVALEPGPFLAHLGTVLQDEDEAAPERLFAARHVADLYLALAASHGDSGAISALRELADAELRRVNRRLYDEGRSSDDVLQLLLERLTVAVSGRAPRLRSYAGRAPLRAWLRIALARLVADWAESSRRMPAATPLEDEPLADAFIWTGTDPETAHAQQEARGALAQALREVISGLEPQVRWLLRQQFVHGLGIDAVAVGLGVHRATAARQLAKAREQLLSNLRRDLGRRVGGTHAELEGLLQLVASRLDFSLRGLLAEVA